MTNRNGLLRFAVLAGLAAFAGAALAHHSTAAEFDENRPVSFSGTIKNVEWMNPHIYVNVEMRGADGKAVVYRIEGTSPNTLYRRGWRKDSVKQGETVKVVGIQAKNPESRNVGSAAITNAAGVRIYAGSAPGYEAQ